MIALVRIVGALPVLRWSLAGALIAIGVDLSDLFQMNLLDLGGVSDYQTLDKWLDLAYMGTFLFVALRWSGPARYVAVALFGFRMVGLVMFQVTGDRWLLLLFPNVFEFWFVFVAAVRHYRPAYLLTTTRSLAWFIPVFALKAAHEIVLHGWRGLDNYVAIEVVRGLDEYATTVIQGLWLWLTGR